MEFVINFKPISCELDSLNLDHSSEVDDNTWKCEKKLPGFRRGGAPFAQLRKLHELHERRPPVDITGLSCSRIQFCGSGWGEGPQVTMFYYFCFFSLSVRMEFCN
ncbi:hypothetical protein TNIN_401991 [Trichonephila inaurata madagascariensis]|uniref:Uncharacterized protein n=1 Tax=Trichonephila inaurata madagascariensis TaxID=2747483 RepID=A0A8X6IV23_9ARAC|nr:hypothetical protein TNIN_401991 [Trichonephila inaurata madagascariensis]